MAAATGRLAHVRLDGPAKQVLLDWHAHHLVGFHHQLGSRRACVRRVRVPDAEAVRRYGTECVKPVFFLSLSKLKCVRRRVGPLFVRRQDRALWLDSTLWYVARSSPHRARRETNVPALPPHKVPFMIMGRVTYIHHYVSRPPLLPSSNN